jgi:hypothetical protein
MIVLHFMVMCLEPCVLKIVLTFRQANDEKELSINLE